MQRRHRLVLTVLGVIFVVLGIMLGIALLRGGETPADTDNSEVDSNSARVVDWAHVPAPTPTPGVTAR